MHHVVRCALLLFVAPLLALAVTLVHASPDQPDDTPLPALDAPFFYQIDMLVAADATSGDQFGYAVAVDGDTLLVGAPWRNNGDDGAAYIFTRNAQGEWGETAKLTPSQPGQRSLFGYAVDLQGDLAVVGAPGGTLGQTGDAAYSGAVYVFRRGQGGPNLWGEVARLAPPSGQGRDRFGFDVAIDGLTIAVGAPQADLQTFPEWTDEGAVYLFRPGALGLLGWVTTAKLTAAGPLSSGYFGQALALNEERLLVLGRGDMPIVSDADAFAELFAQAPGDPSAWNRLKSFNVTDHDALSGKVTTYEGVDAALDGEWAVITSRGYAGVNTPDGDFTHLFRRNQGGSDNWGRVQRRAEQAGSLALDGDRLAVGNAYASPGLTQQTGEIRVYASEEFAGRLAVAHSLYNENVGYSVVLQGDLLVAGAIQQHLPATPGAGAVYLFAATESYRSVHQLFPADLASGQSFSTTLTVNGDLAAVGDMTNDRVLIFARSVGGVEAWRWVQSLPNPEPGQNRGFGGALALCGDWLAVGADGETNVDGYVYLFQRISAPAAGWQLRAKLAGDPPPIPATTPGFGQQMAFSCGIHGPTRIFVGHPHPSIGGVYRFERDPLNPDNWVKAQKIPPPIQDAVGFGTPLAAHGAYMATASTGSGVGRGVIFLYKADAAAWTLHKQIRLDDAQPGDLLGLALALHGEWLAAAVRRIDGGGQPGRVYLFRQDAGGVDNWGVSQFLSGADGRVGDRFGYSLALDGERLVSGAPDANAAYIFQRIGDGWGEMRKISGAALGVQVGQGVGVSGETVIVGAHLNVEGVGNPLSRRYFVFQDRPQRLELPARITASDAASLAQFGSAVDMDGDWAIVGADLADGAGKVDAGAAYILRRNPTIPGGWQEMKMLVAADGAAGDQFGYAVAIRGETVIVGAYNAGVGGQVNQGAAYLFGRNVGGADNWGQIKKLTASDGQASDFFGWSVDMDGDWVLVGASAALVNEQPVQGAAYLFRRDQGGAGNWGQVKKLVAADGQSQDRFGIAVALDGDWAAVGAHFAAADQSYPNGAAYLFGRNTGGADNWGQARKLIPTDDSLGGSSQAQFGFSLALHGDQLVVGAPGATAFGAAGRGAAYLFRQDAGGVNLWGQTQKIAADDGALGDQFGAATAIYSDTVVVGTRRAAVEGAIWRGAAYLFAKEGEPLAWRQIRKLTAHDGAASHLFGSALALDQEWLLVGAPQANTSAGALYPFDVSRAGPDLGVSILGGSEPIASSGVVTFSVGWRNVGKQPATGAALTVQVPALANASPAHTGWQCTPNSEPGSLCTLALGPLVAGQTGVERFDLLVNAAPASSLVITAAIRALAGSGFDPYVLDNQAVYTATLRAAPAPQWISDFADGAPGSQFRLRAQGLDLLTARQMATGFALRVNGVFVADLLLGIDGDLTFILATDAQAQPGLYRLTLDGSALTLMLRLAADAPLRSASGALQIALPLSVPPVHELLLPSIMR